MNLSPSNFLKLFAAPCLAFLGLTGCVQDGSSIGVEEAGAGSETSQEATTEALRLLNSIIYGSPDASRNAESVIYWSYQEPLANCMTRAGFSYRYPPFFSLLGARSTSLIPDTFSSLAELPTSSELSPSVQDDVRETATAALAYSGPVETSDPGKAYSDGLTRCIAEGSAASPERPMPSADLANQFQALMAEVDSSSSVVELMKTYPSCMAGHGFTVEDQVGVYIQVSNEFSEFAVDYVDPTRTRKPTGPEWDHAVDFEGRASIADNTCRAAAHNAALAIAGPLVIEFANVHAKELDAAEAFWDDLAADPRLRTSTPK